MELDLAAAWLSRYPTWLYQALPVRTMMMPRPFKALIGVPNMTVARPIKVACFAFAATDKVSGLVTWAGKRAPRDNSYEQKWGSLYFTLPYWHKSS